MLLAAAQTALRFHETPDTFAQMVDGWTRQAATCGASLLVFPEDIGLSLVCIDDYELTEKVGTLTGLAARMALRYWRAVVPAALAPRANSRRALFLRRASRMREVYVDAFSAAARRHKIAIVAGSISLSGDTGHEREVYNTSYTFDARGQVAGIVRKVGLIQVESRDLGISSAEIDTVGAFEVDGLCVGVAICLDAWSAEVGRRLANTGAQLLISPQANPDRWTDQEQEQNREGLFARCQQLGLFGVQAMAVGSLAGLEFEGCSAILGPKDRTPDGSGIVAQAQSADREELVVGEVQL